MSIALAADSDIIDSERHLSGLQAALNVETGRSFATPPF
jgi:hypothetical protein